MWGLLTVLRSEEGFDIHFHALEISMEQITPMLLVSICATWRSAFPHGDNVNTLNLRWFKATDIAKRDNTPFKATTENSKKSPVVWYSELIQATILAL
jgi:hypothetical protein